MTATLSQLVPVPTLDQLMDLSLKHLKGVGWPRHTIGFAVGKLSVDGVPSADFDVVVTFIATGGLGVGRFQFSLDGGTSYSVTILIPADGVYVMPGTGCTLTFDDDGDTLKGFQVNDEWRIFLRQRGFPITSWQPLSTPRTLVENDVEAQQAIFSVLYFLGTGGYVTTAQGPWLDLLAQQSFNTKRRLGVATVGNVRLTDAQGQGPFTVNPGELIVATGGGLRYLNTQAFTLPLNGTGFVVEVQAELTGVAYNAPNDTVVVMVSSQAGVTVNNPDPGDGSGTWITRGGNDIESDKALAQRLMAMLPALGYGAPTPNYDTWAKAASDDVTKTSTSIDQTTAGQLNIYVAGSGGGVPPATVAAVQAYITPRAPQCVTPVVSAATPVVENISGSVFVHAGFEAQAQAGWTAALAQLVADMPIGPVTVYYDQIKKCFLDAPGVRNAALITPLGDILLSAAQVLALTDSTTITSV